MAPRKGNKKNSHPKAKVQNKAIKKTPTLDLPAEIIEKIVRTDPELFRTCRAVSKTWEGECSRLAGLARNRIPLSTISWNIPRKGRGSILRRRRQILSALRIPQMFETARFNSFTSFLLNRRLMDQARHLTILELDITKSFLQLSEANFARCGLQLYCFLTEAQNLTSFKMTVLPKLRHFHTDQPWDKFLARVTAFERSIFHHAGTRYGEDPTTLRKLIVNNCAFFMFDSVFHYLITISPSLEEVTVQLSPQPVNNSDSASMQEEISDLYKNLAILGNYVFRMDQNPYLRIITRCLPVNGGEPYEYRLAPFSGVNPTVKIISTREDFVVDDGTSKLQNLLEKAPTLRVVDPSFFNNGGKF